MPLGIPIHHARCTTPARLNPEQGFAFQSATARGFESRPIPPVGICPLRTVAGLRRSMPLLFYGLVLNNTKTRINLIRIEIKALSLP